MQIAILGYRRNQREDVANRISECLGKNSPYTLRQYGLDDPEHNPAPPDTAAVFVIVDDGRALIKAQKLGERCEGLPIVIVRLKPEHTLEGKLTVKHYMPFPITERDMREALRSAGVKTARSCKLFSSSRRTINKEKYKAQIAIFGDMRPLRDEAETHIRSCIAENAEIEICQYGMDEPAHNPAPDGLIASFVIMSSASELSELRTIAGWGKDVVIAAQSPDYALEGIRNQVRYYIFFPLVDEDVREALRRMGLEVKPNE